MNHATLPVAVAIERFLTDKKHEVSRKTYSNYQTSLRMFRRWCDTNDVNTVSDLDLERIQTYKEHRLETVKPITARNGLAVVRQFCEFLAAINAFPADAPELIRIPTVSPDDEVSDDFLTKDEADALLDYLTKYHYGSHRHAITTVLWKTGMRLGGLYALDLDDFDPLRPALQLRHRPETHTPLKNKHRGERDVLLSDETGQLLEDYIEHTRPDTTDDHGRKPLFATEHGRRSHTSIQKEVYAATRPCYYNSGACPFDRDPETCNATMYGKAYECPGSLSPHGIRHGYVTAARNAGQSRDVTKERANMSEDVMEKHYDKGTHDEKAERRRDYLKDI